MVKQVIAHVVDDGVNTPQLAEDVFVSAIFQGGDGAVPTCAVRGSSEA